MTELEKTFTDSECIARYNSAADKSQMLTILAQCQQMSLGKMANFLRAHGCEVPEKLTYQETVEKRPHNPKRDFTAAEISYIRSAYEDGVPVKEIQNHLHCRNGKIMETISEMGLELRRPRVHWNSDKDLALIHHYIRGDTVVEIAKKLEVSRYGVERRIEHLREAGMIENGISV